MRKRRPDFTETEKKYLTEVYGWMSIQVIADLFTSTIDSIRVLASRWGISHARTYTLNESYFETIDTADKAYWLGFIFADGSLGWHNGIPVNVHIEVGKKDIEHIKQLQAAVGSNAPIGFRRNCVMLLLCSRQFAKPLTVLRPKETAEPWKSIPANLHTHFIRGVFDGDGCISRVKSTNYPRVEFLGNKALCQFVQSVLGNGSVHKYHGKNNWLFHLVYNGKSRLRDIAIDLYGDGGACLERKFWRFVSYGAVPVMAGAALPNQINSTVPAGGDLPSTIDNRIRNLALAVEDILGIPDQTNITTSSLTVSQNGLVTVRFIDAGVSANQTGHLQRVGTQLSYFDGTSPSNIVLTSASQTLTNKTYATPNFSGTGTGLFTQSGDTIFYGMNAIEIVPWTFDCTAAANALTFTLLDRNGNAPTVLAPIPLVFRGTLVAGTVNMRTVTSSKTVVVSNGSTLGFATQNLIRRLWAVAHDFNGEVEMGVYNAVSSSITVSGNYYQPHILALNEAQLYTTVAEGGAGAADLAHVLYTTTARANVPIKVLGYIEVQTGNPVGTWSNQPIVKQVMRAGTRKAGDVVQRVFKPFNTSASTTTVIPNDNSIPQRSEGAPFMTVTFNGQNQTNVLDVDVEFKFAASGTNDQGAAAMFRDGQTDALIAGRANDANANGHAGIHLHHAEFVSTNGGVITYEVRGGGVANTLTFNGSGTNQDLGGVSGSSIVVTEYFA